MDYPDNIITHITAKRKSFIEVDSTCTSFISGLLPEENQCQGIFQRVQLYDREFFQNSSFCSEVSEVFVKNCESFTAWEKPHDCQKCWHEWYRASVFECWSITILKLTYQNRINDKMPEKRFPVKILEYFSVAAVKSVGTNSGNPFLKWHADQKHLEDP